MWSKKRNKMIITYLLIVLAIGFAKAKTEMSIFKYIADQEIFLAGEPPEVGEIFEVIYRIRLKPDAKVGPGHKYYIKFGTGSSAQAEIIDKDEVSIGSLEPGEWREFRGRFRIPEPYYVVFINVKIRMGGGGYGLDGASLRLYLIDSVAGQYTTSSEEYFKKLYDGAEWYYDPAGEFTTDPVHPDCAKKNKLIIAKMQELEPKLTDWEAIYLHYDGIQALMGGLGTNETTDEERWQFLLDMDWLEKHRAGKEIKEKWLKELIRKYRGKPLIKEQGLNPKFFRNNIGVDNTGDSNSEENRWSYIYFKGQFRYKKHRYDKSQGLLTQTDDEPIANLIVRVRSYWSGSGGSRWTFRTNTDSSGNFLATLSWTVPNNIWIYAHPLIYCWGPTSTNRVIRVSDPTPTSYLSWRDPIDTTIFLLPRVQGGIDSFYTNTDTFDFGTMYVDSFKAASNRQPISGAVNISQCCLHARTFMNPPPDWTLRMIGH